MKNTILEDIIKFSKKTKDCNLNKKILTSNEDYMKRVDTYFGTTRFQSIVLVAVFEINSEDKEPTKLDLAKYFQCSTIELYVYKKELEDLKDLGILQINRLKRFMGKNISFSFKISEPIITAIMKGQQCVKQQKHDQLKPIEVCEVTERLVNVRAARGLKTFELYSQVNEMLEATKETSFVNYLNTLNFSIADKISYLYLIGDNLNGNYSCDISNLSNGIFYNKGEQLLYSKTIFDKTSELIKYNLIQLHEGNFFSNAKVSLTEHSKKKLDAYDIPIRLAKAKKEIKLIKPETIVKKHLFHNTSTKSDIETITESLKPLKYKQITKSLKVEGFRIGICALFYGVPGTGKTEGVYQLAKTTNRAVWKVDLSELKSMWFGESQKLVKGLFKDYKELCSTEKRVPILLLNEADAVLGKRNTKASSSTDKAENAIQNIFLDCLEDFEGILFATTNLEESLDGAFERRFLFKVAFERPDLAARTNIWKTKLKGLSQMMASYLASTYDLSGGEIENIVRKYKMAKVINPKIDMKKELVSFCDTEKLNTKKERSCIGFQKTN